MTRMKQLACALTVIMAVPFSAIAQNYQFDSLLRNGQQFAGGIHGLAVDAEDKIWVQPWIDEGIFVHPDNTVYETRPIFVFDKNGEHASFSPINAFEFEEGEFDIFNRAGIHRGLAADHNGNILVSIGTALYRINHKTGEVMTYRDFDLAPLTAVSATDNGEIVVAFAENDTPVLIVDEEFEIISFLEFDAKLARSIIISRDGKFIVRFDPYARTSWLYYSPNGVQGTFGEPWQILQGMFVESSVLHPITGHLWVSTGSRNNRPASGSGWFFPAWLAIDIEAVLYDGIAVQDAIVQEVLWHEYDGVADLRPRGVAFSNSGERAYLGMYRTAPVQIYTDDSFATSAEENVQGARGFALEQNYPNPFNPSTSFRFTIEEAGMTTLRVYNVLGQAVAAPVNQYLGAGSHTVHFDASGLNSGVYLYVLESCNMRQSKHMTLVK